MVTTMPGKIMKEIAKKKKEDLNNKISQAFVVSKDLTIKPPQLKQKPPNNKSI